MKEDFEYGTRTPITAIAVTVSASLFLLASASNIAAQEEGVEPQFPQQQSAGDLLRACASSRLTSTGRERRRYCAGFVSGVEEAVRILGSGEQKGIAEAFVNYGATHEGELRDPAAAIVLHALATGYPCSVENE